MLIINDVSGFQSAPTNLSGLLKNPKTPWQHIPEVNIKLQLLTPFLKTVQGIRSHQTLLYMLELCIVNFAYSQVQFFSITYRFSSSNLFHGFSSGSK